MIIFIGWISFVLLAVLVIGGVYLWTLALASVRTTPAPGTGSRATRFAVLLPAHDEAVSIGRTVERLAELDYPADRYTIHVVADYCTDDTAFVAREAGAVVHERSDGPRGSKGAALSWLLNRVLGADPRPDAVVIFDADTQVHPGFLAAMDARISSGASIIQGRHRISNPEDGTYPALAAAMMRIDNRFGNQGRVNLGLSAKHMGDSICFRSEIIARYWRELGLTEDYALRQRLLMEGLNIDYEPEAVGAGEAPQSWAIARAQRARWLKGTYDSSRGRAFDMLIDAVRRRDHALFDGALQALLPSFSTLVLLAGLGLLIEGVLLRSARPTMLTSFAVGLFLLVIYPVVGLIIDRAPAHAYRALVAGPPFIIWRTVLALTSRHLGREITWRRTPRRSGR